METGKNDELFLNVIGKQGKLRLFLIYISGIIYWFKQFPDLQQFLKGAAHFWI